MTYKETKIYKNEQYSVSKIPTVGPEIRPGWAKDNRKMSLSSEILKI